MNKKNSELSNWPLRVGSPFPILSIHEKRDLLNRYTTNVRLTYLHIEVYDSNGPNQIFGLGAKPVYYRAQ